MSGRPILVNEQAGRLYNERSFALFVAQLRDKEARRYAERHLREPILEHGLESYREFATTQPTYPGGGNVVSIDNALRFPVMIARAITELAYQRFVSDRILNRGTAQQVASGAVVFQRAESIFPDKPVEEVGVRSQWPRSGWTPGDWFAAIVHKYGLETPLSDEAKRRNAIDELARAQRKLANALVKFVDTVAMNAILTDAAVGTQATAASWGLSTTDKIADLANARGLIQNRDLGYIADTLVINPTQEIQLLTDKNIRDALPREVTGGPLQNSILSGQAVPMLGLRQILVTNYIAAGTMLMLNSGVVGSIADEQPAADENYTGYDPGAGQTTIYVKTYREENSDETIIRGARFPAVWISEPGAATKITGA